MITQTYKLNMVPSGVPVVVNVSQYDSLLRLLQFELYDGSAEYQIPASSVVTIRGRKPDNTAFSYECTWSGNVASTYIKDQMTVLAGKVPCEIRVTNLGDIVGTANFTLMVEPSPILADTPISETDIPLIETAIQAADRAEAAADSVEGTVTEVSALRTLVGSGTLNTTAQTLVGAVNELDGDTTSLDNALYGISGTIDSLENNHKYKTFNSVTDLGLTSGTATITQAMPILMTQIDTDRSTILICNATEFASTEYPSTYGTVMLMAGADRPVGFFFSKLASIGDFRMYANANGDNLTGTWIPLDNKIHAGDVLTFNNSLLMSGYLTGSNKSVYLGFALPKEVASGVTCTVTSCTATIRHADGGYIANNVDLSTLGTLTAICGSNQVRIQLELTTASSLSNNSVVSCNVSSLVLTFA